MRHTACHLNTHRHKYFKEGVFLFLSTYHKLLEEQAEIAVVLSRSQRNSGTKAEVPI